MDYSKEPLLKKALDFAKLSLMGKKRLSGEDVVDHCLRTAEILSSYKVTDPQTLAVAILHHTLKDSAATLEDVKKEFGEEISQMLQVFEKLHIVRLPVEMRHEFTENLRKMFLVLAKDLRIVLIKIADIMDNLTTLQYLDEKKRQEVAKETLEIFAPLVDRLGMGEMKGEMQDLAFKQLHPEEFLWLKKYEDIYLKKLIRELLKVKEKLTQILKKEGIDVRIQSRVKHMYSLYTKLQRPEINKDMTKVYDLIAMRVIVADVEECYKVLGFVHSLWKPIPNYVRDHIAQPKLNGYMSIHTTVFTDSNLPFEVQIRTQQMHEKAEYGLAAHWNYTEKKETGLSDEKISKGFATSAEKLDWVKMLSEWQKEITNDSEFLKTVKTDFFGQRIFCFTPKGDVKDLPDCATPIDFAYYVHTNLGNRVTAAKVNNKVVALNTKLKNGDVVELILSKDLHKKPSRDWLQFVVTGLAKRQIKRVYLSR